MNTAQSNGEIIINGKVIKPLPALTLEQLQEEAKAIKKRREEEYDKSVNYDEVRKERQMVLDEMVSGYDSHDSPEMMFLCTWVQTSGLNKMDDAHKIAFVNELVQWAHEYKHKETYASILNKLEKEADIAERAAQEARERLESFKIKA
jgi:hypothetical protein